MAANVNLLLVGAGQTGASIGLALGRSTGSFRRLGYDPDRRAAGEALELGAFDERLRRPHDGADEIDLALICVEAPAAIPILESLAGRLRPDVAILSTARVQTPLLEKVGTIPAFRQPYVGTVPFLGPKSLTQEGPLTPSADLYDGGRLGIVTPAGTPEGALDIALDLAAILGARPFFLDAAELDAATATSDHLPPLLAAAVLASLASNPGWRDQQHLVGRSFDRLIGLLDDPADPALTAGLAANRHHLQSRLAALAEALTALGEMMAASDEAAIAELIEQASANRQSWRAARTGNGLDTGLEAPEIPRLGLFERLLGGLSRPRPRNP